MNFNYLKYLFKNEKQTNIVLVIILMIIFPLANMTLKTSYNQTDYFNPNSFYEYNLLSSSYFIVFIYFLAFVMVIVNFRYLHSKRSVDTYMQLPLKKLGLYKTKLVYTIIQVVGFGVLCYLLGVIVLIIRGFSIDFRYIVYVSLFISISLSLIIFFNAYLYQKCNSMIDGIIVMVMYHLLLLFIDFMLMYIVLSYNNSIANNYSLFSIDMTLFRLLFAPFSKDGTYYFNGYTGNQINAVIVFLIVGIGSLLLSFKEIKNRSSERAEQITKDHFCYPVIIIGFVWVLFLMLVSLDEGMETIYIGIFVIFIPYIIGMFIYNRKVILKAKYIITYVVTILLSIAFVFTINITDSFGLANMFPNNYKYANAKTTFYTNETNFLNEEKISSYEDIDKFEKLLVISDNSNINYEDSYLTIKIKYYDDNENVFDYRRETIQMSNKQYIEFVNSLSN